MKIFTLLLLLLSLSLQAADQQFYFVAKKAPLGSLSSFGQNSEGVYLRWDSVEGNLPSEIDTIELRRDGVLLRSFPAQAVMDSEGIDNLYTGMANERRKLETLVGLSRYGASQLPAVDVHLGNFTTVLHDQLNEDYWKFLASRVDFNVARASYRAYLDTGVSSGVHEYELTAVSIYEVGKRLAYLKINLDETHSSAGAIELEQVFKSQCTSPEYALDHYTVALHWKNAGVNEAEQFLNSVTISGYDIYRTIKRNATDADFS